MRACIIISALLLCGCNKPPRHATSTAPSPQELSVLDQALAKYSNDLAQAQKELPNDTWEEKPFRHNVSAGRRLAPIADPMFREIELKLKDMSLTNLVKSFKVVPYPFGVLTNDFGVVGEYVYAVGNQLIKNEIKTRPLEQLRYLPKLGSHKLMLVEGPQGFGLTLRDDLQEILEDLGLTNGWSQ